MKGLTRLLVAIAATAGLAACAKTQAKTVPSIVALDTPAPPARVAVPVPLPEPEVTPAPEPPAPEPPAKPRAEPPARAERTPPTPPAPTPSPPPPAEGPVLQTTINPSGLEQRSRSLIDEAERNLGRVKYKELSMPARAQYDSAASFIRSAKQALQIKNYLYAEYLATKAAAVARELVKG